MHSQEPVQENETQKLFWDFEKQTDLKIFAKGANLLIVNKKRESTEY